MYLSAGLWLMGGLVLLVLGAEILVRGASAIALKAGIPPLIIGLTVVAFGTSSPETAVSLQAATNGQADLSIGNVVGSNIFNIIFILGISAIIAPLAVSHQLIKLDVPIMIGFSILVLILGLDGSITRLEGVLLFTGAIFYTGFLIIKGRRENNTNPEDAPTKNTKWLNLWWFNILLIGTGLVLLAWGSDLLVKNAVYLAEAMGVSDLIIGLTIVSAGTSLPEAATSVIASLRGERELAVGNVVGSNIFNLSVVLGLAAICAPSGMVISETAIHFDLPVMIAVAIACLPIFFTDHVIDRWEGFLFLGYYIAYTLFLILESMQHQLLEAYSFIMFGFVIPITVITLIVVLVRAVRK